MRITIDSEIISYSTCSSEMQNLSFDADQLIPQVIEKSKLVALGDTEELEVMKTLLSEWCTKVKLESA